MSSIKVHLKKKVDHSYKIIVEPGLIQRLPLHLKKNGWGQKYAIITDHTVKRRYGETLLKALKKAKIKATLISLPSGEKSKTWKLAGKIGEKLLARHYHRKDCLIALGGGVIGDLTGFVASVYMRGIPYIQIPTSLLAMVDSSIGGKTGVNLPTGKNILGTFTQPKRVYIDSHLLETLPMSEMRHGLAEIIKYAVIRDKGLFRYLEKKNLDIFQPPKKSTLKLNHKILNKIITRSCRIKAAIVEQDEKESFLRMLLNYGHTYGHGLEAASQYKIAHGQAISIGMCLINGIAVKKGLLKEKYARRINSLLKKAGLPTKLPKTMDVPTLNQWIAYDKKRSQDLIYLVIPVKIGQAKIMPVKIKGTSPLHNLPSKIRFEI